MNIPTELLGDIHMVFVWFFSPTVDSLHVPHQYRMLRQRHSQTVLVEILAQIGASLMRRFF